MQRIAPFGRNALVYAGLVLLLLLFAFAYVISFEMSWRAVFVMHVGTLFLLACGLFMKDLRNFLLFMMIFVFPMEFGYHFIIMPPPGGTAIEEVWSFANGLRIDSADAILLILYVHWALRLAHERSRSERFTLGRPLGSVMLVWIVYILFASMLKAHYKNLAFFEVFVLVKGFFLFLYLANNITTLRDFRVVYYALLSITVFHALFMLFQFATGLNYDIHGEFSRHYVEAEGFRPAGFIGCADCASSLIDIMLPMALTHFLVAKDRLTRIGLLASIGILLGGLIVTKVRAGLMAVILLTLAVLWVSHLRKWITWRRMGAVILVGIVLLILATPLMIHRFRTGEYGQDRLPLIYTAINMIKANPLLGVGANNYSYRIDDYRPRELSGTWIYIVHNEFLLRMAEQGLVGMILFYTLVGLVMVRLWRLTSSPEPWIFIGSCGLFAAFVGSLPHRILTSYYFQSMFYMFCIVVALTCFMQRFEEKRKAGDVSGGSAE